MAKPVRIAHISDLHFGRIHPGTVEALARALREAAPDLVVVSGDLTQRARPAQFVQAREFLDSLPFARVVVPGNHDLPLYQLPERWLMPLRRYRSYIAEDAEPVYEDDRMIVLGVNSARRFRVSEGHLRPSQRRKLRERLAHAGKGKLRVLVAHHPFGLPEDVRVDLFLTGHLHASKVERHESGALLVHAGTATSSRHREELNAFNVISAAGREGIEVRSYLWSPESGCFA